MSNFKWTTTIDILGQIAYGNMFNANVTPIMAKKELKRMAQQHDLLIGKSMGYSSIYLPKYDLVKLTTNLEPREGRENENTRIDGKSWYKTNRTSCVLY